MENLNLSIGLQLLDGFTKPAQRLLTAGKAINSTMIDGQKALNKIGGDRRLIAKYEQLTKSLSKTANKITENKNKAQQLGRQIKAAGESGEKVSGNLKRQYEAATKALARLNRQHGEQRTRLAALRGDLRGAGYDTKNLAEAQRRLGEQYGETSQKMKQLAMNRAKAAQAQKAFDHTLQKAANMTFIAQGMRSMGQGALNMISQPINQMRSVERAKGDLQALGIEDTGSIIKRGRELQKAWAYIDTASFTAAAYDIKSGISALTDIGVADVTEQAALTAKATKADVGQMTSLFATGYGIFKNAQFGDDTDKDFASKFGAGLTAAVQSFKTDGSKMQQAIESMGAGLTISGISMSEQLAALGMLQGSMTAGSAGTTLAALERSSAQAQERFNKMGMDVQVLDERGNMKGLADLLEAMQSEFGKEFTTETGFDIQEAFGSEEAVKFFKQLWGQQDQLRGHARGVDDATRAAAAFTWQVAESVDRGNQDARLQKSQQRWALVQEKFGMALVPFLELALPLLEKFAAWTEDIVQNGGGFSKFIVGSIGALALFGTVMAPVVTAFASLTVTAAWLRKSLQQLGIAAQTRGAGTGGFGGAGGGSGGKKGGRGGGRMRRAGRGIGGLANRAIGLFTGGSAGAGRGMLSRLGGAAKSNAILGAGLGALSIGSTLMDNQLSAGQKAKAVSTDVGSIGGGLAGMTIGATIGSVVPVVGTAIGGILGGLIGSMGGEALAKKAWSWFESDEDGPEKGVKPANAIINSDLGRTTRQVLTGATMAAGVATTAAAGQTPLTVPGNVQHTDQSQTTITLTIQASPDTDEKRLAELAAQQLEQKMRQLKRERDIEKGAQLYDGTS